MLNRSSPTPLCTQIASTLESEISRHTAPAGARLATEAELMVRFGVSRITIREALDRLTSKGLVVRKQGKGTFVATPKVQQDLVQPNPFFDTLFSFKGEAEARLIFFGSEKCGPEVATALAVDEDTPAIRLERLYLADGSPVATTIGWIITDGTEFSRADVEGHSTGWVMEHRLGVKVARTEVAIRGESAGRKVGERLQVRSTAPILVVTRVRVDNTGRRREFVRFFLRSDSYELVLSSQQTGTLASTLRSLKAAA